MSLPPAVELPVPGGKLAFSEQEKDMFDQAFAVVDTNDDGMVQGREAAVFLRRSKLPDTQLREVRRDGAAAALAAVGACSACIRRFRARAPRPGRPRR